MVEKVKAATSSTALLLAGLRVLPLCLHLVVAVNKEAGQGWNNKHTCRSCFICSYTERCTHKVNTMGKYSDSDKES